MPVASENGEGWPIATFLGIFGGGFVQNNCSSPHSKTTISYLDVTKNLSENGNDCLSLE